MLNPTIIRLTTRTVLSGRRLAVLIALSSLIVVLAVFLRVFTDATAGDAAEFLQGVSIATLLPLFGLIIGTGVINPEIDDGSIMYLLAKPVPRATIVLSKVAVAVAAIIILAAVPTALAALIMSGAGAGLPLGFGVGAAVAGVVYGAIFLLLSIITRHAVIVGLVYALAWESLVGSFIPGARVLSVQQWGLSIADSLASPGVVEGHVGLGVALVLAFVVTAGCIWLADARLRVLTVTSGD